MLFDIAKTIAVVKGGILEPQTTWKNYLEENPSWQQTAVVLTGPLVVANVLLSLLFSRFGGGFFPYGYPGSFFTALLMGLVMSAIGVILTALVFSLLAGPFKGKSDFSRAFAAVSLAAIPAWVAGPIGSLIPWVGALIALAGGILSLVYMYRIMPLALKLPGGARLVHFIVSLVVIIILNVMIGAFLGRSMMGSNTWPEQPYDSERPTAEARSSGFLGEMQRQGELMERATSDIFEPPADGKLTEDQVNAYVVVLRKTRALHEKYAADMQRLSKQMEAKKTSGEEPSLAGLAKVYGGMGRAMSANNAEMEVVKTAGDNWAEHLWIKEQLHAASIHQGEGSEAIAHNYALYMKYESQL